MAALTNLYVWLRFFHLLGLAVFLFAHGISGGASLLLRSPLSPDTRKLLQLSQRSSFISNPALLVVIVTGVWMTFQASLWGRGWIWAGIVVLVAVLGGMGFISRPYYLARDAAKESDDVLAQRLSHTRPIPALVVGAVGLATLIFLMVFKPF
jgi:uncharacterized membrane protein